MCGGAVRIFCRRCFKTFIKLVETMMLVENAELSQVRTLISAFEKTLDEALLNASRQTGDGKKIDDFQVHAERVAYRATEFRAAREMLNDAERQLEAGQDEPVTGAMALAYTSMALHNFWSDANANLADYGFSEHFLDQILGVPEVKQTMRAGMAESLLRTIGRHVLETNGVNNTWLGDELCELTRQTVRDFARQEIEPIAERLHRQDELAPDTSSVRWGNSVSLPCRYPKRTGAPAWGFR